jgi:amicyanin
MTRTLIAIATLAAASVACSEGAPPVAVASVVSSPAAVAATVDMTTSPLAYKPDAVTVKTGEVVSWKNVEAAPHTVTSTAKKWTDSGLIKDGETFSLTFNAPGTYDYHCTLHHAMMGKITVT